MLAALTPPTPAVHASFLVALREYHREQRRLELDVATLSSPGAFRAYVELLHAETMEAWPRPAGRVPHTVLWWIDGDDYIGRVSIRHRLTDRLRREAGHIGYDVRPSARRRGHAGHMLAAALPWAASLGIDPVVLVCKDDNVASRKVIERNGGLLTGRREGSLLSFTIAMAGQAAADLRDPRRSASGRDGRAGQPSGGGV